MIFIKYQREFNLIKSAIPPHTFQHFLKFHVKKLNKPPTFNTFNNFSLTLALLYLYLYLYLYLRPSLSLAVCL